MNIKVIAVGKIREKFVKAGIDEFLKRIRPYSSIEVKEIAAEPLLDENLEEKCRDVEGEKILSAISEGAYVIAMEVEGKALSSEDFAGKIKSLNQSGVNQVAFVIGGATGLSKSVKKRADYSLSMSKMTLPHQMARLFLLEQIYRGFKINAGEPYHK